METQRGAAAYFPAVSVYYRGGSQSGTTLSVPLPRYRCESGALLDIPTGLSGHVHFDVTARYERNSANFWGQVPSNGMAGFFLNGSSMVYNNAAGNCTALAYASKDWVGNVTSSFEVLVNSSAKGKVQLRLKEGALQGNAFGLSVQQSLKPTVVPRELAFPASVTYRVFSVGGMNAVFYGSSIRNRLTGCSYQCHPMRSADGKAALFETTTQQLVTDAALSAN